VEFDSSIKNRVVGEKVEYFSDKHGHFNLRLLKEEMCVDKVNGVN